MLQSLTEFKQSTQKMIKDTHFQRRTNTILPIVPYTVHHLMTPNATMRRLIIVSFLLLAPIYVDSFTFPSTATKQDQRPSFPNPQNAATLPSTATKQDRCPSFPNQQNAATSPLHMASGDAVPKPGDPPLTTRFLNRLFKGMTLPFPILRNLAVSEQDSTTAGFSLKESLLAILAYLALGVVAYSSSWLGGGNNWSLVDALYFSVVTFTTVGYGDLCPTTTAGKAFTIMYGLSGISILGAAIATIGSRLVQKENDMIQAAREASRKRVLGFVNAIAGTEDDGGNSTTTEHETIRKNSSNVPSWRHTIRLLARKSIPAFSALLLGGVCMGKLEGWTVVDSIYYSFITAGTLGYGDFSPVSRPGRLWGVVFIPLAVAAAGDVLGNVASALLERRQDKFYQSLMERELSMEQLVEMDTDNNGTVSREEYVTFMLKEMELVSEDQFEELHAQFKKLDVDGGGYLDKTDLSMILSRRAQKNVGESGSS
jgi:potassium channel subfamily K